MITVDTTTPAAPATEPRYGGWHRVTSPGIGRLGLAGTILGIAGLVLSFIVATLTSAPAGLVVAVLTVVALLPLVLAAPDGRTG